MQIKEELEIWYEKEDAWGYKSNPFDTVRKDIILSMIPKGEYLRALDIGCGEGWITKDLPAKEIHGIELSDKASERFPENVKRIPEPDGKYDLVVATGVLYKHYDYQKFMKWIKEHSSKIIVLCNIEDWEVRTTSLGKPIHDMTFNYREYRQHLKIYDVSTP